MARLHVAKNTFKACRAGGWGVGGEGGEGGSGLWTGVMKIY